MLRLYRIEHVGAPRYVAEREGLSLVDGIIYSCAQGEDCCLITGDEHFRGKKNVVFEKE